MNKTGVSIGIIGAIVVIGSVSFYMRHLGSTVSINTTPAAVGQAQATPDLASIASSSTVPLMQSTGTLFSQYKYFSKAHEIFPTLAADTKKALGAFSYSEADLGNNTYRFTLTNGAEGYHGQSVVVSAGQSVYFIEPSTGDDSLAEDSVTADDSLMAVDAQGYILN